MPKTIIFANGVISLPDLVQNQILIEPDDTIICADGGTLHALSLNLTPNLIVGDLDSLSADVETTMMERGVEIIRHPARKNRTDLELALSIAIERGATEILLLTALGGRLDQQLANILLLTRPEWHPVRFSLADGRQRAWLLTGPDDLTLAGKADDTLSILPFSTTISGLDLDGVEWPLTNQTVALGSTLTISNKFLGNQAYVRLREGMAFVVHIQ